MSTARSDLVARLAALGPQERARLRARLAARDARPRPALTPGQRRLWEGVLAADGRPVDVVCQAVRLSGARVDLDALAARIERFAEAHEALRTTFRTEDGEVRPVVHERLAPRIVRTRCADRAEAHAAAAALAAEPFDLEAGPLLRAGLAEGSGPDEAYLLVVVHNLVFDAWSFELLLDWLADSAADPADRPPGFSAFAAEQRRWVQGEQGRAAAAYWAGEAADPPPPLPTDRPRGASAKTGRRLEFSLPADTAAAVAAAARRQGATPFSGWVALLWAALARTTGSEDVMLGTFTANRDRPGAAETVGYLLNVLPLRLRDPGDGGHRDRTAAANRAMRSGLRHAAYPGELIAEAHGRGVPGAHPLFDAVFVFENLTEEGRTIQGARVETADVDKGTARYDLTLAVQPGAESAECWLEYDTSLYEEATVRALAGLFADLAADVAREERSS